MDQQTIAQLAEQLYLAERNREPIPPLTSTAPGITIDDAYAVQLENVRRVTAEGHVISGKKIGLTSEGIQKQMGVDEPDYGHLFASMDCPGGDVPADALMQPKIEGEIAFLLKADLTGGSVTPEDVRAATECVCAAFEIVDSRIADWKIGLADTISDNASSGRYVLSERRVPIADVDLPTVRMDLYKNGAPESSGTGAAVLGDPAVAVAWLANRLWNYGVALKAGEIILSGAFTAAPLAKKGDVFEADFHELGKVSARFV